MNLEGPSHTQATYWHKEIVSLDIPDCFKQKTEFQVILAKISSKDKGQGGGRGGSVWFFSYFVQRLFRQQ